MEKGLIIAVIVLIALGAFFLFKRDNKGGGGRGHK